MVSVRISSDNKSLAVKKVATAAFLLALCGAATPLRAENGAAPPKPSEQDVLALKQKVQAMPQDAKAHYELGHAWRLTGQNEKAVSEFLQANELDPSLFVAAHELSLCKARPDQLDEPIDRLSALKEQQPRDLMLRVALSELLEQRGRLYPAAKVLVDMVYDGTVPARYMPRVKARIHYLLSKNKDAQTVEKVHSDNVESESAPLPLPESSLRRNLAATKLRDSKVTQNFGHNTLLP